MPLPYVSQRELGGIAGCMLNILDTPGINSGKRIREVNEQILARLSGGGFYLEY